MQRHQNLRLVGRLYERISNGHRCVYCGDLAQAWDHFLPLSAAAALHRIGFGISGTKLLPACRECNSIAGCKVFVSVGKKRRYIQENIAKKHRKILEMPNWNDRELAALSDKLRGFVFAATEEKRAIIERLTWTNSSSPDNAKIAQIRLSQPELGLDIAPNSAAIRHIRSAATALSDRRLA
jgi:hypothetical protein